MRILNAYTLQYTGLSTVSGIIDWVLTPYYMKLARPNDAIVLYTNEQSVKLLGELWPFIAANYDEVYTDLNKDTKGIFSAPKFEAMERELTNYGPDFVMVDNDVYAFSGFLDNIVDYCVYHDDGFIIDRYREILNNEEAVLEAPSWMKWFTIPYNCAVIRINNNKLLEEYINLFYTIKAERLSYPKPEKAMIKEQWSLSELFYKYRIFPRSIRNEMSSLHKGALKRMVKPLQIIAIQEYILELLFPEAFKIYKTSIGNFDLKGLDMVKCINSVLSPYERDNLLQPVLGNSKIQEIFNV